MPVFEKAQAGDLPRRSDEGISLATLADRLGPDAARELFQRIDVSSRRGELICGINVRDARGGFSKTSTTGRVQFVVPGRSHSRPRGPVDPSEGVIIIAMDDFEAVVRAGQQEFDWAREFAPRDGLAAAVVFPQLKRGSRGRRQLRG